MFDKILEIERDALARRLIEIEEVAKDKNGKLYWTSCGEYIDGTPWNDGSTDTSDK